LKGKQRRSSVAWIVRTIVGGEKRSERNDAWKGRRSKEQEKMLRSVAGEIERKKGAISSSRY
jgi:hypothetical protein